MMDEKKIEEAQENIFEDKFLFNGEVVIFTNDEGGEDYREEMYHDGQIKEAISLGAHWAIEQFLEDLWHDIRQERIPKKGFFLIEMAIEGRIFYVSKRLPAEESILSSYLRQGCVRRWSNLEDLLKHEEGGE